MDQLRSLFPQWEDYGYDQDGEGDDESSENYLPRRSPVDEVRDLLNGIDRQFGATQPLRTTSATRTRSAPPSLDRVSISYFVQKIKMYIDLLEEEQEKIRNQLYPRVAYMDPFDEEHFDVTDREFEEGLQPQPKI